MGKNNLHIKSQGIIILTIIIAIIFIMTSLIWFSSQVNGYINRDIRTQMESIQQTSMAMVENELNYLKRITESAAGLLSRTEVEEDDIVKLLKDHTVKSNVVRTLFITLDGHAYTSYAGYLGQDEKNTAIEGKALSDIKKALLSQPYYDTELKKVIFGVVAPTSLAGKQGVLVSSYDTKQLFTLLKTKNRANPAEVGIVNYDGRVIIGKKPDQFNHNIFSTLSKAQFSQKSAPAMKTDFAEGLSGYSAYSVNGVSCQCTYAPLEINGWYIVTTVKETSLKTNFAQLEEYGTKLTIVLIIIMVCMVAIITIVIFKEQRKIRKMLIKAATTDGLTGIYNRIAAENEITTMLQTGEGLQKHAMLIIDVDNFKEINDTLGHIIGDDVLKRCAVILDDIFGGHHVVGRIGGDEFVVFVKKMRSREEIEKKAKEFIDQLYIEMNDEKIKISASVGIAWGESGDSFKELYKRADSALYTAKEKGKGRVDIT